MQHRPAMDLPRERSAPRAATTLYTQFQVPDVDDVLCIRSGVTDSRCADMGPARCRPLSSASAPDR